MRTVKLFFVLTSLIVFISCNNNKTDKTSLGSINIDVVKDSTLIGSWVRMSQQGPIKINIKKDGTLETDLGNNNSIDVISNYSIKSDTIAFVDKEGKSCPKSGTYKVYNRGYSLSFDVIDDLCNGRIKTTSGYWVRPNHAELVNQLNSLIKSTDDIEYILHRGRIFLALGKSQLAKKDFDTYLKIDSTNSKVFINRAATRFPNGLKGIVYDCSKAIALDSTDKNAYFLRGLANYALDKKQEGCNDFKISIDLGFEILKEAESYRCKDFWE